MDLAAQLPMIEPPRGMYPCHLDSAGRLKLPVGFQRFFDALRDKALYVTSLDRKTAQVFPMEKWRQNEDLLEKFRDDQGIARRVAFNAADLGAESEMDRQGRILFPPELRRELKIEGESVRVYAYRGHIEVLSPAVYEQRKQEAQQVTADDMAKLEAAGLV